jgi:hypothetical protein
MATALHPDHFIFFLVEHKNQPSPVAVGGMKWLDCPFEDFVFCQHWKPDGCEKLGRIEIILPGLINDSDLIVTLDLPIGYLLVQFPCL